MSVASLAAEVRRTPLLVRTADFVSLAKPRIAVLVLVTVAVAGFLSSTGPLDLVVLTHALLGTALVAASASALNQWIEGESDAQMERTAGRPIPAGRLSSREVLLFGAVTIVCGTAYLVLMVNFLTGLLGLITWLLYVVVYTPLKARTHWNTVVGAIGGAMPVLIGASATGSIDLKALTLFLLVYLWQFPHFMAIAWIYRHQYGQAGLQMLTVVDESGRRAGRQAVIGAWLQLPVSLVPALLLPVGPTYIAVAVLLGIAQLVCAWGFWQWRDDLWARRLLKASLVYLPAILLMLALGPLAGIL